MGDIADMLFEQGWYDEMAEWLGEGDATTIIYEKIPFQRVVTRTGLAWLLQLDSETEEWFPKSVCQLKLNKKIILVPRWLVEQKNLDLPK